MRIALGLCLAALSACRSPNSSEFERAAEPERVAGVELSPSLQAPAHSLAAARLARDAGDLAGARAHVTECVEQLLGSDGNGADPQRIPLMTDAGALALELRVVPAALAAHRYVREELERTRPDDDLDLQRARSRLAQSLEESGDLAGALELHSRVLEACERTLPEGDLRTQRARATVAGLLYRLGQTERALALQRQATAGFESALPLDHRDVQRARMMLGILYQALGDLPASRSTLEKVVEVYQRTLPPDDFDLASARLNLGVTLATQGDHDAACALYELVLPVREATLPPDHPELVYVRGNLSNLLRERGEFERALALDEEGLAALERRLPTDHPDVVQARHNLGASLYGLGDLTRARAAQESVLAIRERTLADDHRDLNLARQNLGLTLLSIGDVASARTLLDEVLSSRQRTLPDVHPDTLRSMENLALTFLAVEDHGSARRLLETALESLERSLPEENPFVVDARANLASVMRMQRDFGAARAESERVLAARERALPDDNVLLAIARSELSAIVLELGEPTAARALSLRALEALEQFLPGDHPDVLFARARLAGCSSAAGDAPAALEETRAFCAALRGAVRRAQRLPSREAREAAQWLERTMTPFVLSSEAGSKLVADGFAFVEELRTVALRVDDLAAQSSDPAVAGLQREARQLRRKIGELLALAGDGGATTREIADIVRARDRVEAEIAARAPAPDGERPTIESGVLARALPPGAAAVGYRRYRREQSLAGESSSEDRWLAHVVRSDGALTRVDLGPAHAIDGAVAAWRSRIDATSDATRGRSARPDESSRAPADDADGTRLRELVLDPVLDAAGDVRSLFVCLDANLHLVPLDALPFAASTVVGDRIAIHVETSFARILSQRSAPVASDALLVVGGVDYDARRGASASRVAVEASTSPAVRAGWSPLPGTKSEAMRVAELFRDTFATEPRLLMGADADKSTVSEACASARFIHIATHGWFVDAVAAPAVTHALWAPLRFDEVVRELAPMTLCGLALAGANAGSEGGGRSSGILTAEELAGFDLGGCELAVLSACETSVGVARAGQSIESLQVALQAAGVRGAITSLWMVDDDRTRELFEEFYSRVWTGGESKSAALWNAKLVLREKGYPLCDWAAWVLTGSPD
jgi:CHAT domain-containing protein/tetratricopeptide (TPR) repeat protein